MNIVEFSNWLLSNGTKKKVVSDIVSRVKRINNQLIELNLPNIDEQYKIDCCNKLFDSLSTKVPNKENLLYGSSLPLNKPEIANYKHSLKKYLEHLKSIT